MEKENFLNSYEQYLEDLSGESLKVLAEWEKTESYLIIRALCEARFNFLKEDAFWGQLNFAANPEMAQRRNILGIGEKSAMDIIVDLPKVASDKMAERRGKAKDVDKKD